MIQRKRRGGYIVGAFLVFLAGLASRRYRDSLPTWVGEFAGDILWASLVFLLISSVLFRLRMIWRGTAALAVSFLVELSQLYHAAWIDAIRQNALGGLVLGKGFLWSDILCYAIGVLGACLLERSFCRDQIVALKTPQEARRKQ